MRRVSQAAQSVACPPNIQVGTARVHAPLPTLRERHVGAAVLIAAISGRSLAASARTANLVPLVADCFGDDDTRALADRHVRISRDCRRGFDSTELIAALEKLAKGYRPIGVICGTGFEDRPDLLRAIGERWMLLGNRPSIVAQMKHPARLAELCRRHAVPHPAMSFERPPDRKNWLFKRAGGSGGAHVACASQVRKRLVKSYFQRRLPGTPVSALVLGNGRSAMVLGLSTQWTSPTRQLPFRYGGAVRPAMIRQCSIAILTKVAARFAAGVRLLGLNSLDFLVDCDAFWMLEVNPRPGATFDIFEPDEGSLLALHLDACNGVLPREAPRYWGAMASAVVYADREIRSIPQCDWPAWTADHQRSASSVKSGEPVCTVFASAPTPAEAKQHVERRATDILARLDSRS
jgi:uncharacterized protein